MMRALWSAASGMVGQQMNVDVISNNLSNVSTTSYKKQKVEFKDMLYETMQRASVMDTGGKPVNLQVGHGTMPVSTVKDFTMGNLENTERTTDFAIDGDGFFTVMGPKGTPVYTKDGSFKLSVISDGTTKLTTSEGYPVLDTAGAEIIMTFNPSKLIVGADGSINYTDVDGVVQATGQSLGVVTFPNISGLENIGSNLYTTSPASGLPIGNVETENKSTVMQYFLESSNVQVVEEMVNLIVAQRAYEINSKAIQSADSMLETANNLRR